MQYTFTSPWKHCRIEIAYIILHKRPRTGLLYTRKVFLKEFLAAQNKFKEHRISNTTKVFLNALIHVNANWFMIHSWLFEPYLMPLGSNIISFLGSLASTNIPETTFQNLGFSVNLTFTYLSNIIPFSIGPFDNWCLLYSSSKLLHEYFVFCIHADKKRLRYDMRKRFEW